MASVVIADSVNPRSLRQRLLIDAAAEAGADMVKFQTFSAVDLATELAPTAKYQKINEGSAKQQSLLEGLELKHEELIHISNYCTSKDIKFLSTAFGIQELNQLVDRGISAIKVASGEITHLPLLEAMSTAAYERDLNVYLSTGMCTLGEIEQALKVFVDKGLKRKNIVVMHCVSAYPTPVDQVNLNVLKTLQLS